MATPIGADTVTAVTRRYILPEIVDQIYLSNTLFYRLSNSNKRVVRGGTHIEVPLLYKAFSSSTWYQGFDLLDTTPQDSWKNGAWDWKQLDVSITVDGLTLLKNDSPESIANIVRGQLEQARMEGEDRLGTALFNGSTVEAKRIDSIQEAVDDGTVQATYGGIGTRTTTNDFWQPAAGALDTTTTTLTLASMQTVFGAATEGARHPTLIASTQANYNRYWNLNQVQQRYPTEPMGRDEQLASAGFTNLLFNNVPFAVDSHCNANHIYFLNEDYIELVCHPTRDMVMTDFIQPVNQDAMTAHLQWAGNLIFKNVQRQGKMTAVAA